MELSDEERQVLENLADRLDQDYDNADATDGDYYQPWLECITIRKVLRLLEKGKKDASRNDQEVG